MFRTTITIASTLVAAAALAVPVSFAASHPRTPAVGQGFHLAPPLQGLTVEPTQATYGFHLAPPLQGLSIEPTHAAQGFHLAPPLQSLPVAATASGGNGFAWGDAAIGGGIVAGVFLVLIGVVAAVLRRPRQAADSLSHS